ncbi:hypothetical protein P168DRAFT_140401 [Aspergillus campestris IBT 28561]|uniref:Uncharacterized protein n=1 Tax=Aspergillus campestris (strain IBT 28561) TaxID=1392248 RepID=A0A2I1D4Q6_ASPC2|nr:uncharacterized protein P168DRAFT_140401 [Aspergillus campestris IBT 28561]PKY04853.1 hypothetical protein P168DRAFT_140401 [Aspergillus campestris IBT 28561]
MKCSQQPLVTFTIGTLCIRTVLAVSDPALLACTGFSAALFIRSSFFHQAMIYTSCSFSHYTRVSVYLGDYITC